MAARVVQQVKAGWVISVRPEEQAGVENAMLEGSVTSYSTLQTRNKGMIASGFCLNIGRLYRGRDLGLEVSL